MRRVLALLLLVGFSFPLIAPAFAPRIDEASLPACCRRNGRHHCMMDAMMMGNVPTRYQTVEEKCPCCPFTRTALMLPHAFAAHESSAPVALASTPAAAVRDAEAGYRISADRTRRKRGPPSLLAL